MVVKVSGMVVGLVQTKAYNNRPAGGRVDLLVPERDSQKVMGVKCDVEDLLRLREHMNKNIELPVDLNEYDIVDEETKERKQGVSYKLYKPSK